MESSFSGIKYHVENIIYVYLGKLVYFPILTVVIRCVLKQGDLFYPQVYLDDALYQSYK